MLHLSLPKVTIGQVLDRADLRQQNSETEDSVSLVLPGLLMTFVGMVFFNFGLTYGLGMLGNETGQLIPAAFQELPGVHKSPIYGPVIGHTVVLGFSFLLGVLATLAEPALSVLGGQVEELSGGQFKKTMLIGAVSMGVALGSEYSALSAGCRTANLTQ